MKKMMAILAAMVMVFAFAAATAEETPFTFRNGVTFGLNMDQVIASEPTKYHEIENERTLGPVTFGELEYENVDEGGRADLKYLFVGNELAAIRVNYEERAVSFDQVVADLSAKYGEAVPVDLNTLGNGIYAVDDEGRLEGKAAAIVSGKVMIIIEQDEDDVDVTYVDLGAAYINVQ